MEEPTKTALEAMGLLGKSRDRHTSTIGIADQRRRKSILESFKDRHKDDDELCNVAWSADDNFHYSDSVLL